jgi:hypothetical protein
MDLNCEVLALSFIRFQNCCGIYEWDGHFFAPMTTTEGRARYSENTEYSLRMKCPLFLTDFNHSFIRSSMALQPYVVPWPLLHFCNLFTQSVELLGRMFSPSQGRYLHTRQHKHRINVHTSDIHALSGIRTHDPEFERAKTVHVLDRAATVTGSDFNQN